MKESMRDRELATQKDKIKVCCFSNCYTIIVVQIYVYCVQMLLVALYHMITPFPMQINQDKETLISSNLNEILMADNYSSWALVCI